MIHRQAFTLPEILVSIMIFMIISGAMFGIFLSVTQLYREGEFSRSSNDESQIVANLLEQDIVRAVPASAGGVFYAWLDEPDGVGAPGETSGNCVIGWVIRNDYQNYQNPNPFVFVLWGIQRDLSTEPLRRSVMNINQDLSKFNLGNLYYPTNLGADLTDPSDDTNANFNVNNPIGALSNDQRATTISNGCLHFSASLTGTSHNISSAHVICHKPSLNLSASNPLAKTTYWTYVTDGIIGVNDEPLSQPNNPGSYYSNHQTLTIATSTYQKAYPNAIRISVVLSGNERFQKEGLLQADLSATDKDYVRITGIDSFPSTPGSLIRLGNAHTNFEWIGYYDYNQDGCKINTNWEHGPCMPLSPGTLSGRGVLKSTPKSHSAGTKIRIGRLLVLSKTLPQ